MIHFYNCNNCFRLPGSGPGGCTVVPGGHQGQVKEGIDEGGNLMWLVDFKLDFFNDIEKNNDKGNIF